MPTTRHNEVSLFGNFYPILGDVEINEINPYANKTVTGDYTKDSERNKSSLVFSDNRGGIGIKDMVEATDGNRCYWSTCETGFKGHLVLPPLVTDCTNPTSADCVILIEYANEMYAAFGTDLRKWVEGSASWSATLGTLTATSTDAFVHKSKLYFACGTDFDRWDGSTLTTGTVLASAAKAARYLCEWDSKLFILSNAGVLQYSTDEGVNWTSLVTSTLEAGMFTGLFIDYNTDDDLVVTMTTKQGVYALDYANAKWIDPHFTYPQYAYGGLGPSRWRESSYIPVGTGIYQLAISSNHVVITPMGPDRDYGLPSDYRGNIIKVLGEHNGLYALLDATTALYRDLYTGGYVIDGVLYDNVGFSCLLKFNGQGWGATYVSSSQALASTTMAIASADDFYRLWFAANGTVYYFPLSINLQNPLELTDFTYAANGLHIYPWFDADNGVVDKTAFSLSIFGSGLTSTEYIKVYYGTDYDDNTWTLLTNAAFPDGQIDTDGEASFTFAAGAGLSFKAIRFKVELCRGSTATASPDLQWLRLEYIKTPDQEQQFVMTVDCSRDYRHKRASTMVSNLKTAVETKTLGTFIYRTYHGTSESFNVRALKMAGVVEAGRVKEGLFEVTLLSL